MPVPNLAFFRDDFRMSTWLLIGAALQCLLSLSLPTHVALLPALFVLGARAVTFVLISHGTIRNPSFDRVHIGRATAQIPHEDGSPRTEAAEKEIVVLILGARSNQYARAFYDFRPALTHLRLVREADLHRDMSKLDIFSAACGKTWQRIGRSGAASLLSGVVPYDHADIQ